MGIFSSAWNWVTGDWGTNVIQYIFPNSKVAAGAESAVDLYNDYQKISQEGANKENVSDAVGDAVSGAAKLYLQTTNPNGGAKNILMGEAIGQLFKWLFSFIAGMFGLKGKDEKPEGADVGTQTDAQTQTSGHTYANINSQEKAYLASKGVSVDGLTLNSNDQTGMVTVPRDVVLANHAELPQQRAAGAGNR